MSNLFYHRELDGDMEMLHNMINDVSKLLENGKYRDAADAMCSFGQEVALIIVLIKDLEIESYKKPSKTCINCAYARMDGYEFAIHCQHKKSKHYDEEFDNPVSEDDSCEHFKVSNVDIRFRDEIGG